MQEVSKEWDENQQQQITSKAFIKITLDSQPNELLQEDKLELSYNYNNKLPKGVFNKYEVLANYNYAIVDDYYTILDGSYLYLEDYMASLDQDLYSIVDAKTTKDIFSFNFKSSEYIGAQLPGIYIAFDELNNCYLKDFDILIYNFNNVLVAEFNIRDNDKCFVNINKHIKDFFKLSIKNLGEEKVSVIREIRLGNKYTFTNDDIIKLSYKEKISPINTTLHNKELNFTLDALKINLDPNDEESLYHFLAKRDTLIYEVGYFNKTLNSVEYINKGTFYLVEFKIPTNGYEATFRASNLFSFLTNKFNKNKQATIKQIMEDVLTSANLGRKADNKEKWRIEELENVTENTFYTPIHSYSDMLLLCCTAQNASLYTDGNGDIVITNGNKLFDGTKLPYKLDPACYTKYAEVITSRKVRNLIIKVYDYTPDGEAKLQDISIKGQEIINSDNKVFINFDGTNTRVSFTISNPEVFLNVVTTKDYPLSNLEEYEIYQNMIYAKFKKDSVDPYKQYIFKISYTKLNVTKVDFYYSISEAGDDIILDNPLITNQLHARQVASYIANTLSNQEVYEQELRLDPKIEILDNVLVTEKNGNEHEIIINEIDYSFNGMFKAKIKGRRNKRING